MRAAAVVAGIAFAALPVNVDLVHADPPPCGDDCAPGIHDRPSMGGDEGPGINIPGSPGVQPPVTGGRFGGGSVK